MKHILSTQTIFHLSIYLRYLTTSISIIKYCSRLFFKFLSANLYSSEATSIHFFSVFHCFSSSYSFTSFPCSIQNCFFLDNRKHKMLVHARCGHDWNNLGPNFKGLRAAALSTREPCPTFWNAIITDHDYLLWCPFTAFDWKAKSFQDSSH